jgi:hypothetical protein
MFTNFDGGASRLATKKEMMFTANSINSYLKMCINTTFVGVYQHKSRWGITRNSDLFGYTELKI